MAAQTTSRQAPAGMSLAPFTLGAMLLASLLGGGVIGAAVGAQMDLSFPGSQAGRAPAAQFDAVGFRAEERAPLGAPWATFDAVQFRAEERVPLGD